MRFQSSSAKFIQDPVETETLSIAPPLRLSNTCTDHIMGAFPPFLKLISTFYFLLAISCPLWNNISVQLHTRAEGRGTERASHCQSYQFPVPSTHKVKRLQKPLHRAAIVLRQGRDTKCSFMCTANKQPRASHQHPGSFWVFCKHFVERWHFNKLHPFSKASVLS